MIINGVTYQARSKYDHNNRWKGAVHLFNIDNLPLTKAKRSLCNMLSAELTRQISPRRDGDVCQACINRADGVSNLAGLKNRNSR